METLMMMEGIIPFEGTRITPVPWHQIPFGSFSTLLQQFQTRQRSHPVCGRVECQQTPRAAAAAVRCEPWFVVFFGLT